MHRNKHCQGYNSWECHKPRVSSITMNTESCSPPWWNSCHVSGRTSYPYQQRRQTCCLWWCGPSLPYVSQSTGWGPSAASHIPWGNSTSWIAVKSEWEEAKVSNCMCSVLYYLIFHLITDVTLCSVILCLFCLSYIVHASVCQCCLDQYCTIFGREERKMERAREPVDIRYKTLRNAIPI